MAANPAFSDAFSFAMKQPGAIVSEGNLAVSQGQTHPPTPSPIKKEGERASLPYPYRNCSPAGVEVTQAT